MPTLSTDLTLPGLLPLATTRRQTPMLPMVAAPTAPPSKPHNPSSLSDHELYQLCCQYGEHALLWRRKFIGLLPEVNRRRLYTIKSFSSIFEFAAKLAGISEEQVRRALNLENRFRDKPALHLALTRGQISLNKLVHLAPIATPENAEVLAKQARMLSTRSLQTLVRDEKTLQMSVDANINPKLSDRKSTTNALVFKKLAVTEQNSIIIADQTTPQKKQIELSLETITRLHLLKQKGFNLDQLINELLDEREEKIEIEKQGIAQALQSTNPTHPISRYIPEKIRKILQQEHGTKCSVPHCRKPAAVIHHTRRFALTSSHDPQYLAPLCREHHQIAHSIDAKFVGFIARRQLNLSTTFTKPVNSNSITT